MGRRPMYFWMPTGLPALSSMKSISGSLTSTGLPSRSSNFSLAAAADDLLGRDAIDLLRQGAHELDAAAGDDEGLEAVRAQVGEQFEHRLIDHLRVRPLGLRMLRGRDPVLDDLLELLGRHAGVRGHDDFEHGVLAAGERAFHVALEQRGRTAPCPSTRDAAARAPSRGRARRAIWKYIGCSAQSVPSLSNVAMRSAGGTKSGEPSFVTFATKSTMAFFGLPSFHDGSGSACASGCAAHSERNARGGTCSCHVASIESMHGRTRLEQVRPVASSRSHSARSYLPPPPCWSVSITWSRLKLPGFLARREFLERGEELPDVLLRRHEQEACGRPASVA